MSRELARTDLFYLTAVLCNRNDIYQHIHADWLIARCRDIEKQPHGTLDLWAREHYKSTLITFGLTIQDILSSHGDNPNPKWGGREISVGIFSCTRPIAKGFLRQIRDELQTNETLMDLFPDVLYDNPVRDAPKWSEDDGLIVKRKNVQKESTVEAWGLVDGQPTSKHFFIRNYDDIVTLESVRSPNMIRKTTESLEMSYNLGTEGGYDRYAGTRYRYNDTYSTLIKRGTPTRVHPCFPADDEGVQKGQPVLQSQEYLDDKRKKMGPYVFACQMVLNPKADEAQGFKEIWLRYYNQHESDVTGNIYIIVDPANEKRKQSDYTSGWVLEACSDQKIRVREMLRDRMSLVERTGWLFEKHRQYTKMGCKPQTVGYEKYGKDTDIDHIEYVQEQKSYSFDITPLGGSMGKADRIRLLIPDFKNGNILLPNEYIKTNYEGKREDLVQAFRDDEYLAFPIMEHDDMLDSLARLKDVAMDITFPMPVIEIETSVQFETPMSSGGGGFVF